MVKIVSSAFHKSFLILTSGPSDYDCTEIKIKSDKEFSVLLVAYFILRRHRKCNALEQWFLPTWGQQLDTEDPSLRKIPTCTEKKTSRCLSNSQHPCLP